MFDFFKNNYIIFNKNRNNFRVDMIYKTSSNLKCHRRK